MKRHLDQDLPSIYLDLEKLLGTHGEALSALDALYDHRGSEPDTFKESDYFSNAHRKILDLVGVADYLRQHWLKLYWHTNQHPDDMW